MTRSYSLACLSANGADPDTAVLAAAQAGCDRISFRLLPGSPTDVPPPLRDAGLLRRTLVAMRDTGIGPADAEMIRIGADLDLDRFTRFLDRLAEMGARRVLVAGDDADRARISGNYCRLCQRLDRYGLSADLEFMPWTAVATLADAKQIVRAANHRRAAILVDTLHFDRSGSSLDELAAIPRGAMNHVQVCDGPVPCDPGAAGLIRVAREPRLMPGRGGIDLAAIGARLPPGIAVSVEVPDRPLASGMGLVRVARAALEATGRLFAAADRPAASPMDEPAQSAYGLGPTQPDRTDPA